MAKTLTGVVSSDVADKTIIVTVVSRQTHPIYGKQYTVTRKYAAHDEKNEAQKGDKVIISETRPYSKTKSFKLDAVIEKAHESIEIKQEEVEIQPEKIAKEVEKPKKDADVADVKEKKAKKAVGGTK